MITGVTIGEISSAVTKRRIGIAGLASPSAASVPSVVASAVAATPISRLLASGPVHVPPAAISRYQRSDQASGSSRSMPSVNVKYGSALKLSGTITRIGATRKTKISVQTPR